jgi:hypothetical protein
VRAAILSGRLNDGEKVDAAVRTEGVVLAPQPLSRPIVAHTAELDTQTILTVPAGAIFAVLISRGIIVSVKAKWPMTLVPNCMLYPSDVLVFGGGNMTPAELTWGH